MVAARAQLQATAQNGERLGAMFESMKATHKTAVLDSHQVVKTLKHKSYTGQRPRVWPSCSRTWPPRINPKPYINTKFVLRPI